MIPARIKPVIVKEFRQIRRDRRTLGVLLVIPAFLLVMYVYALDLDVQHLPTVVVDLDRTPTSRKFIEEFFQAGNSEYFDNVGTLADARQVDRALLVDQATVALILPRDFSETLREGRQAEVQVIVNGIMSSTAAVAIGYVEAQFQQYTFDIIQRTRDPYRTGMLNAVNYQPRVWYNPELKSSQFLIPGLIAFILMITTVVATTLSIVRERELGSMEQLMVSPLRPGELILGKLIPYGLISIVSTFLVLASSHFFFGVEIKGSYVLLFLATFIYLIGALGLGLLISTLVATQEVAFLVATLVTMLPTFILSGFVFPISNMPVIIQAITYFVPARYFLVVLRGIMVKGVGMEAFDEQFLLLTAFALLMLVAGTARLRSIMA